MCGSHALKKNIVVFKTMLKIKRNVKAKQYKTNEELKQKMVWCER